MSKTFFLSLGRERHFWSRLKMEFFLWNLCERVRTCTLGAEYTFFAPLTPGFHHHITCGVDLFHKERESISAPDHLVTHMSAMHHTMHIHFLIGARGGNFPGKSTRTHKYWWIVCHGQTTERVSQWRWSLSVSDCLPLTWFCLVWCVVCLPQRCWPASLIPSVPLSCKLLRSERSQQISLAWSWKKSLS